MKNSNSDRNLLYGVLALQMGFVGTDALIAAMKEWALARSKALGEILIEQGALSPPDHPPIEAVVQRLLDKHGDPSTSLTAIDLQLAGQVQDLFRSIADSEVRESLALLETRLDDGKNSDKLVTVAWGNSDPNAALNASGRRRDLSGASGARFQIIRPHARGGLGEVYVARDEELDRTVALKEIRAEYAQSEKLRDRFIREAEINGNLEHPGIVPVYGLGSYSDGRPYYAMRFVQGETLQVALDRFHKGAKSLSAAEWTIGLRQLLRRFLAICDAIDYAHTRGVLHRDLKPSNILLGKFGETLIIDWGLAKIIGRAEPEDFADGDTEPVVSLNSGISHVSTMAGETMGSPPFMSPEQAKGNHEGLTPASDIYSLGATFYAVLTGRPPIIDRKVAETLRMVSLGQIEPASAVNPRVPKALEAICLKAMELEPASRYASARMLADDVECWLDDRAVAVYEESASTRALRWSRQHNSLVAASLALLLTSVVALGIIAAVVEQQKQQADEARLKAVVAQQQAQAAFEQAEEARRRAKNHLRVGLDVVEQLVTFGDRQLITQIPTAARNRFLDAASNFIRQFREREPGDLVVQAQTAQVARRLANPAPPDRQAEPSRRLLPGGDRHPQEPRATVPEAELQGPVGRDLDRPGRFVAHARQGESSGRSFRAGVGDRPRERAGGSPRSRFPADARAKFVPARVGPSRAGTAGRGRAESRGARARATPGRRRPADRQGNGPERADLAADRPGRARASPLHAGRRARTGEEIRRSGATATGSPGPHEHPSGSI